MGTVDEEVVVVVWESKGSGPTPARSVSWRPGAEGAPWAEGRMCEKVDVWFSAGTMRRDWRRGRGGGVSFFSIFFCLFFLSSV